MKWEVKDFELVYRNQAGDKWHFLLPLRGFQASVSLFCLFTDLFSYFVLNGKLLLCCDSIHCTVGRLVYYSIIELKQETLVCLHVVNLFKSVFLLNNEIFSAVKQNT